MDLAIRQPRRDADGIVGPKSGAIELLILVVSEFVQDHHYRLGPRVLYTFHPAAAVWVAKTGGIFPNPEQLINDVERIGAKPKSAARAYAARKFLEV